MKRENYYNLIFIAITLLLIGVSLITYWNVNGYLQEVKWVRHSNTVLAQVEKVLSTVKDAETGHRGYQLTRDSVFLQPYENSLKSIGNELKVLDSLFLGEINQRQRGDSLRLLIEKQYRIITTILTNEELSKHFIDRYETNLLIVGRENMDRIRGICQRITNQEQQVLQARLNEEYNLKNVAPITLLLYGFVAIAVAVFLYARINDELRRRRKTENELKTSMEELDQKERRYRSLFERSIDPIFLANEKFRMVDVNSSLQTLFKYSHEEALHLELSSLFVDETQFKFFSERLRKDNHVRDFEAVLKGSGEKKIIGLINCVYIKDGSNERCYQGIIRDITMRKKVERELIQAEKLSTTGKLARTIAHEVRNPLTNLGLALDQLKEEFTQSQTTKVYTDILERNLDRIEALISELLKSSRPRELQLGDVSLDSLLTETVALIKDRLDLHDMKLVSKFASNLPAVCVDKELIKIAFVNIMVNAIEAMTPGEGVLELETCKTGDHITVIITDNGKGIPAAELDNLFDAFYTAKKDGMGLGLTSAQNILNSHKAGIDVKSEANKGTSFYITFNLNTGS